MCFSATASFTSSAVIGGIGVATLAQVRHPREIPFAALPVLFAVHQSAEGLVWLGLQGRIPHGVGDAAAYGYLLYAQGIVPILVPAAILLIEPSRRRRRIVAPFVALGLAAGTYLFWIDVANPVNYRMVDHSVVYDNSGALVGLFAVVYIVATCGSALFSGYPWIVIFGIANMIALGITLIVLAAAFTSIWCFVAAILSVLTLLFFRRTHRREPEAGSSPSAPVAVPSR